MMKSNISIFNIISMVVAVAFAVAEEQTDIMPEVEAKAYSVELLYQGVKNYRNEGPNQSICFGLLLDAASGDVTLHIPSDLVQENTHSWDEEELPELPLVLKDDKGNPFGKLFRIDCEDKHARSSIIYTLYVDALPPKGCKYIHLSGSIPVGVAGEVKTTEAKPLLLRRNESVTFGDMRLLMKNIKRDKRDNNFRVDFNVYLEGKDYKMEHIECNNAAGENIILFGNYFKGQGCKLDRAPLVIYFFKEKPESIDVRLKYRDVIRVDVPVDVRFNIVPVGKEEQQ